uniref:Uncharacterized protein n=1 Tax=Arundo donax TaxID=35708 RepID=A0A0A9HN64_ARUDO
MSILRRGRPTEARQRRSAGRRRPTAPRRPRSRSWRWSSSPRRGTGRRGSPCRARTPRPWRGTRRRTRGWPPAAPTTPGCRTPTQRRPPERARAPRCTRCCTLRTRAGSRSPP